MSGIYTASRVRHAQIWRNVRASGIPITATWIDEAGEGETASLPELWQRCIDEARESAAVILFREDEEPLKGALVETGAALGAGKPVFAVGFNGPGDLKTFSFLYHPMVIRCDSLETALDLAGALVRKEAKP